MKRVWVSEFDARWIKEMAARLGLTMPEVVALLVRGAKKEVAQQLQDSGVVLDIQHTGGVHEP